MAPARPYNHSLYGPDDVTRHRHRIAMERRTALLGAVPQIDKLRFSWSQDLLAADKLPETVNRLTLFVAWATAEGGGFGNLALNNPLNSSTPMPGSYSINVDHVQAYRTYAVGIAATVATLHNGYYPNILAGLAGDLGPQQMAIIIGGEPWGTPTALIEECIPLAAQTVAELYHPAPKPPEDDMCWLDKDPNNGADILVVPSTRGWFGIGAAEAAYYVANGVESAKTKISAAVFSSLTKLG